MFYFLQEGVLPTVPPKQSSNRVYILPEPQKKRSYYRQKHLLQAVFSNAPLVFEHNYKISHVPKNLCARLPAQKYIGKGCPCSHPTFVRRLLLFVFQKTHRNVFCEFLTFS